MRGTIGVPEMVYWRERRRHRLGESLEAILEGKADSELK